MNKGSESDPGWLKWIQVSGDIASMMERRQMTAAILAIDAFLSQETDPTLRSDALGYKADVEEQVGELEKAILTLASARSLVGPTYLRYVHELRLGDICRSMQRFDNALSWYREALETCLAVDGISGGSALRALLALQPQDQLSADDLSLGAAVARKSWGLLRLSGLPDATNLKQAAAEIKKAETSSQRHG